MDPLGTFHQPMVSSNFQYPLPIVTQTLGACHTLVNSRSILLGGCGLVVINSVTLCGANGCPWVALVLCRCQSCDPGKLDIPGFFTIVTVLLRKRITSRLPLVVLLASSSIVAYGTTVRTILQSGFRGVLDDWSGHALS